jgi:hypothetical protein
VIKLVQDEAQNVPDIRPGFGVADLRMSTLRFLNALLNCAHIPKNRQLSEIISHVLQGTFSPDPEICAMAIYGAELIVWHFYPWFHNWFHEKEGAYQLVSLVKDVRMRERALLVFVYAVRHDRESGRVERRQAAGFVYSLDLFAGVDMEELTDGEKALFCALWRNFVKYGKDLTVRKGVATIVSFLGGGVFSVKVMALKALLTFLKVVGERVQ